MKAIRVTRFAETGNLAFVTDLPRPVVDRTSSQVLVRVLACALNPADCRLMSGGVSLVMKPKEFPYTPGLDVCGVVEDVGAKCSGFKQGDVVVAVLPPFTHGGCAEFVVTESDRVVLGPRTMSPIEAASLPTAGCTALQAIKDARVRSGSKLIVLGGSGGVGSLVVQMAKSLGATFVAATSTNHEMVTSLGADQVIDYRREKWWEVVKMKELDAIIDCVGCDESWANCALALGRGGRYIGVVDRPDSEVRSVGDILGFCGRIAGRVLNPFTPSYGLVKCFPTAIELREVVDLASEGKLRAVLDPMTPVGFTEGGMTAAVNHQNSHRAKGKIVFGIATLQR